MAQDGAAPGADPPPGGDPEAAAEVAPESQAGTTPGTAAQGAALERVLGFVTSFVAPLTVVTALLFYFGYVSSREFFLYFGIDVDLLGYSSQQFVMRSPGALFVPVMVLLLLATALILGHRMLARRLHDAEESPRHRIVAAIAGSGTAFLLAGLVLAFLFPVVGTWPLYPFVTPLCLAIGAGLGAYAAATLRTVGGVHQGQSVVVLLVLVLIAGTFWATATVAQWWGLGQARILAADLTTLPAVVLDTKERLAPGSSVIRFVELAPDDEAEADGATDPAFRYRYYDLRLLVYGDDRLYLVPDTWSADASTLVVPFDDSVRLRFRFEPDADPPG